MMPSTMYKQFALEHPIDSKVFHDIDTQDNEIDFSFRFIL